MRSKDERRDRIAFCRCAAILFCCCLLSACGNEGIKVTGTVEYEGQPVPVGVIVFGPDRRKGNEGMQAMADIENGAIKLKERLVIPGPNRLQISTFNGVPYQVGEHNMRNGKALVPMQMVDVELPPENTELTITMKKTSELTAEVDVKVN